MFSMFFGFNGRIGRGVWWIGQAIMVSTSLLFQYLLDDKVEQIKVMAKSGHPDPREALALFANAGLLLVVVAIFSIISMWMYLSTGIQRLHDRGSAGWRILFAFAPMLMIIASIYIVLTSRSYATGGLLFLMACAGILVSWVWQLIEFGMLPGDDCENDYGDPPGAASRREALQRELAALSGEDQSPREITAVTRQETPVSPQFATPAGSPAFGKR